MKETNKEEFQKGTKEEKKGAGKQHYKGASKGVTVVLSLSLSLSFSRSCPSLIPPSYLCVCVPVPRRCGTERCKDLCLSDF